MERVGPCEDLPGFRNHLLLHDGEEDIQNKVIYTFINLMDKAFAGTL